MRDARNKVRNAPDELRDVRHGLRLNPLRPSLNSFRAPLNPYVHELRAAPGTTLGQIKERNGQSRNELRETKKQSYLDNQGFHNRSPYNPFCTGYSYNHGVEEIPSPIERFPETDALCRWFQVNS